MARRKDGRELFELFREIKSTQEQASVAKSQDYRPQELDEGPSRSMHSFRLGDRRQVELAMSLGWVYGILFFVFLALVGSFILGRKTAPAIEPVVTVEAPEEFADETAAVRTATPSDETPPETAPGASTGVAAPSDASAAGAAGAAAEPPERVTARGQYTLRVAAYKKSKRDLAKEFLAWLHERGYEEARIVTSKTGEHLFVTIGSFETTRNVAAQNLLAEIRSLVYKKKLLSDAYYQNVNTLP